jgi:hypothetical protein
MKSNHFACFLLCAKKSFVSFWIASNAGRFNLSIIRMKAFFIFALVAFGILRASAQVSLELVLEQEQFLPSESIPLAVKITNRSGQQLHLGADADWLTFSVEAADGFVVIKNAEVPVVGAFDLENSQLAIKRVDLQPYFAITKPGRYRVIATLHIKDWNAQQPSAPKHFDIINGAPLWAQDFGVPTAAGSPPDARKYTLLQANYLKEQLRLYVQVSDVAQARIYKVSALGPMVSFAHPEAQVDRLNRLNPDGTVARTEYYDNFFSRPRLVVDENGAVAVQGGTRRAKPEEMPAVKSPNELPPMTKPAMPDKK